MLGAERALVLGSSILLIIFVAALVAHALRIALSFQMQPARIFWMFGFQRRFVRMWECEMLCPKPGPLPQTSQLAATVSPESS